MGNIVLLDELTINKIAAGEVIERPASVVKELVENSLDAGASKIDIEVQNGGISYIRITDNGKGIAPDDMEIAFEKHATSKIRNADDITNVLTMGFRGEALPSIAAISRVEMTSRQPETEIGYRIVVEGGQVIEKGECGCPIGTTITVENLFYNTPVRYKFLKKDYTESGYIEDYVTRLALVNTDVSIKLISSGKTIIQTSGDGNIANCVYGIYGKDIASGIEKVDYTFEDMKVTGVIGKPEISRSNKSNQLFFVNKRFVKDKTLSAAIEQAYKGMITIGKFAFCILNIEMPPNKVDVNVHPAKLEVRFEEEGKVFKAIYHAVKNTLLAGEAMVREPEKEKQEPIKEFNNVETNSEIEEEKASRPLSGLGGLFKKFKNTERVEEQSNNVIEELFKNKNIEEKAVENINEEISQEVAKQEEPIKEMVQEPELVEEKQNISEDNILPNQTTKEIETADAVEKTNENTTVINVPSLEQVEKMTNLIMQNSSQEENSQEFNEMYAKTFGVKPIGSTQKVETIPYSTIKPEDEIKITAFEEEKEVYRPEYKFIGIAFKTYIIIEMNSEMYLIDQHAAHERIMYEKVKKNYFKGEQKDTQLMLVPDVITLSHKEMDIINENADMFEKAGFTFEEFGENTIKLTGVPNICIELNTKQLFLDLLDEIDTVALTARQEKEDKFLATIACKAAVKAGMNLSQEEVNSIIDGLLALPNPFTCPHGRPTAIKMSKAELERKFHRR